jgi:hypothetical protein
MIKVYEPCRILSEKRDIAKCSHEKLLGDWSNGVVEYWSTGHDETSIPTLQYSITPILF